jgi:DNA-directed RNA polymerase subunit RPC12/RpoP
MLCAQMMTRPPTTNVPAAGRFIAGTFGFVFAGIGLTVIGFLWFGFERGEFGAPPLFFRIFGSFIAIAFVAIGGTALVGALTASPSLTGQSPLPPLPTHPATPRSPTHPLATGPYVCPHCGAALSGNADVSPHGDVKCAHCGAWINIHGRS